MVLNLAATAALVVFGPVGVAGGGAFAAILASLYLLRVARKRYRANTASFLDDVPVLPALIALVVTGALEALAQPYAPKGALGLLFSGLPAAVGLVVYGSAVLGRRCGPFLRAFIQNPRDLSRLANLAFPA